MLLALAVFAIWRSVVLFRGYLSLDDFIFRYWAHTSPLTLEYLFRPHGGHMNPIGLLGQWALQRAFPGSVPAVMVYVLLWQTAGLAVLWRLMLRLTGRNASALIAFTVGAFSMFGFEVGVWWAGAIYAGPFIFFTLLSILFLVRALQRAPGRWWLWSGAMYALALMSWSRASVAFLMLLAVASALPVWPHDRPRAGHRGLVAALKTNPSYWASLVAVTITYLVFLQVHAPTVMGSKWHLSLAFAYSWRTLLYNVLPATAGGPWSWFAPLSEPWPSPTVVPNEVPGVLVGGLLALVLIVSVVAVFRPALLAYLAWLGFITATVIAIASFARGGFGFIWTTYRYTYDLWIPLALLFGLVPFRLLGEQDPFPARARRLAGAQQGPRLQTTAAVAFAAAFATSSWLSQRVPAQYWVNNAARGYVTSGASTFGAVPRGDSVLPQKSLAGLIHPVFSMPYATTEVVFSPIPGSPSFSAPANNGLFGFNGHGVLERSTLVDTVSTSRPPSPFGYRIGPQPLTLPLDRTQQQWSLTAEMAYVAREDVEVEVIAGPSVQVLRLPAGMHQTYFRVGSPVSAVTIRALRAIDPDTMGVDQVRIGLQRDSAGNPIESPLVPTPTR